MIGIFFILALGLTAAMVTMGLVLVALMLETSALPCDEVAPASEPPTTVRASPFARRAAAAGPRRVA